MDPREHARTLSSLGSRADSDFKECKITNDYIAELKKTGNRIDSTLKSGNSYYKLDYTMSEVYNDNSYSQNHYLKAFTLLELVLSGPDQDTNEVDKLLIPYLDKKCGEVSNEVAKLLKQTRNRIRHGDFKDFNEGAEKFAQEFMKYFHFDYTKYSRLDWVLLHTCRLLDDLLRITISQQLKVTK